MYFVKTLLISCIYLNILLINRSEGFSLSNLVGSFNAADMDENAEGSGAKFVYLNIPKKLIQLLASIFGDSLELPDLRNSDKQLLPDEVNDYIANVQTTLKEQLTNMKPGDNMTYVFKLQLNEDSEEEKVLEGQKEPISTLRQLQIPINGLRQLQIPINSLRQSQIPYRTYTIMNRDEKEKESSDHLRIRPPPPEYHTKQVRSGPSPVKNAKDPKKPVTPPNTRLWKDLPPKPKRSFLGGLQNLRSMAETDLALQNEADALRFRFKKQCNYITCWPEKIPDDEPVGAPPSPINIEPQQVPRVGYYHH